MKYDLAIIIPSCHPRNLARLIYQLEEQSIAGINHQAIIIQESDTNYTNFNDICYPSNVIIKRQKTHADCGAAAKDLGIMTTQSEYIVFWDDDNLYYKHALAASFAAVSGHDVAIMKIKYRDTTLPKQHAIIAGEIDTMNICVKQCLAAVIKWNDGCGRYSDFRWIQRLRELTEDFVYSPIIIGEKL